MLITSDTVVFWMNFALNKANAKYFVFSVCDTRGYSFGGMRGYGVILETGYVLYLPIIYFDLRYMCHCIICITNTR